MRISIPELKSLRSLELEEQYSAELLGDLPDYISFQQPLTARVKATMTGAEVLATGEVLTVGTFTCARCLAKFDRPVKGNFQEAFGADLEKIDLWENIREAVMIEIPLKALCKEDCKGLCLGCGKDKNLFQCDCDRSHDDSRWESLKEFRFK